MRKETMAILWSGDNKQTRDDVTNVTGSMSHDALLLVADYSCFGRVDSENAGPVSPPEIDHSTWSYKSDTVDGKPRLFVKYACNDGMLMKSEANSHLYCKNGRWIGNTPTCVAGETKIYFFARAKNSYESFYLRSKNNVRLHRPW